MVKRIVSASMKSRSSLFYNMSATRMRHECDMNDRSVTRMRHECYTNDTSATVALHGRHECVTSEKF